MTTARNTIGLIAIIMGWIVPVFAITERIVNTEDPVFSVPMIAVIAVLQLCSTAFFVARWRAERTEAHKV